MNYIISILAATLAKQNIRISFEGIDDTSLFEIAERECCRALLEIRDTLDDDTMSDFDCIEAVVRIMETYGIGGGSRHDF